MKAHASIKQWLTARGMRQKHLAEQIPVRPETLSRWLAGAAIPSAMARRRLSDVTSLDVDREGAWE